MSNYDAPYSHANQLSEIGLPNGRGTEIWSAGNTSLQTAQTVGGLKSSLYGGNVSSSDAQDYYRIDVSNRTPSSFLMSGLGADVGLQILDSNGNIVQNNPDNQYASAKSIRTSLNPGTYYVRVYSIDNRDTHYNLSLVNGTAFFVAPYGNDNNSGDLSSPFRTIQHAVDAAHGGDTVFVRDGVYYERQIALYHGGDPDRPLTIAGTPGETAVIDNGLSVSKWSSAGGNVFVGTPNYGQGDSPENTFRVVVDNRPLIAVDRRDQLREGTYWRDFSNGSLQVWAFGGVNPADKETLIINHRYGNGNPQQDNYGGIAIHSGANHIAIDGLIIRASDTGIWATESAQGWGTDLTVKNSEIKFSWDSAIRLDNWDGALIDNNNIHDNGQILLPNYQR
ncbi:putative peptidase [Leptolyngbya sp. NIES-3755]|nr:putative peptidase [Leptolyngbya sp. NIES-3755]